MAIVTGSYWVELTKWHWISETEGEQSREGELVGAAPSNAVSGSFWIESDYWRYIDASKDERRISGTITDMEMPDAIVCGSYWIDNEHFYYIDNLGQKRTAACACGTPVPSFSTGPTNTAYPDSCPVGDSYFRVTWTLNTKPSWAAIEIWYCEGNGCSSFSQRARLSINATSWDDNALNMYGTDGGGPGGTEYRTYQVRIVPACSANWQGPFCRIGTSNQASMTVYGCMD